MSALHLPLVDGATIANDGTEILPCQGGAGLGQGDEEDIPSVLQAPRSDEFLPDPPQQRPSPSQHQDEAELGHLPQAKQGARPAQEETDQRPVQTASARSAAGELGNHLPRFTLRPTELDVRGQLRAVEAKIVRKHPEYVQRVYRPARQAKADLDPPAMAVDAQEICQARMELGRKRAAA